MLQKFFTNPVELLINDKAVLFNSIDDFEFAIDARTAIPLDKITDTMNSSLSELRLESDAIAVAKDTLSKLVSQSPETSSGITMRLKSINSAVFSKDNGWRDIITALNGDESFELCKYKQIALKTYLRYLSNRLGMISSVQLELEKNQSMKEDSHELSMLKTASLDLNDSSDATIQSSRSGMMTLPKGKPVIVYLKEGDKIELLLSKYKCELHAIDGIKFIGSDNVQHPIELGKNKIGRGQGCSVKLPDKMQEISRVHLSIVNHDHNKLELTDLSTHGTHYQLSSS